MVTGSVFLGDRVQVLVRLHSGEDTVAQLPRRDAPFQPGDAAKDVVPTAQISAEVRDGWFQRVTLTNADGKVVAKLYAQKQNPFVYLSGVAENPERMAKILPDDGFAADLNGGLAGFTWISPDQCHDMHGISPKAATAIGKPDCGYPMSGLDHSLIRLGDDYLRETVGAIRSSPVWKDDTAIVIVWDEDDYAAAGGLKGSPIGRNGVVLGGGRAPLIVITNKDTAARKIDAPYNHYSLLATLEALYGVECLGHACEVKDALIGGLFD